MKFKAILCIVLLTVVTTGTRAQIKILFDNVKGETAGSSSDWTIDADQTNMNWNSSGSGYTCGSCTHSNPQQIPTPAQTGITASTPESYWEGALSAWAVDIAKKGYIVETLPYTGAITYGNTSNAQDLSHYKVFIMCEPNTVMTTTEKTALVQFVQHGGGLFMISDHNGSDRNFDGWDSPHIWDDFASSTGNPFGIMADTLNFSGTFTSLPVRTNDSILHGSMGAATGIKFYNGTSFTLSPSANGSVTGDIYRAGTSGNTSALVAHAYYGAGKVAAVGDSSPFDDGTGNSNSSLYTTYATDLSGSVRILIMNITIWLATDASSSPVNGVDDIPAMEEGEVKMVQNPETVTLIYPAAMATHEVHIYNMMGQEVIRTTDTDNQNPMVVNIASLPMGMYILKTGEFMKKFSK